MPQSSNPEGPTSGPDSSQNGSPDVTADQSRMEARTEASRSLQRKLAMEALTRAEDKVGEEATRAKLRAVAARIYAEEAGRPEDFYDIMDSLLSMYSGENGDTPASRKRRDEHHRERHQERPTMCLGWPEEEHPIGHHIASLDYIYDSDERVEVYNPRQGEREWVSRTKYVPGRFGIIPHAILWNCSLTPTERLLLTMLYDVADPFYFHKEGRFVVRGVAQHTLAAHLGVCRQHCNELLRGMEEMGLIRIQSHVNYNEEGADAVYYLHAHEPSWFEYPIGSTRSGMARICKTAGVKPGKINWQSLRTNDWVRIKRSVDPAMRLQVEEGASGVEATVEERHRETTVRAGKDPTGIGGALLEYLQEIMPADVDISAFVGGDDAPAGEGGPEGSESGDEKGAEPFQKYGSEEVGRTEPPSLYPEESVQEAVRRVVEAHDEPLSAEEIEAIRNEILRTSNRSRDGPPS